MKKRICIFCEKWESGGIESFITNVLTHMDLSEIQIDIVVAELDKSVFVAQLSQIGIKFIELSGKQRKIRENRKLFKQLLRTTHYDVVYLNVFQALSMQYLRIAYTCHVEKRIVHSHNTALRKSKTRFLKLGIHFLARHLYSGYATEYLACSKAAAEFMFPRHTPYRFIPNGINIDRFHFSLEQRKALREQLHVSDDCLLIGNVGRLCYQKNQIFLLKVMTKLLQEQKNIKLLLVGDGEAEYELRQQVKNLKIEDDVIFYGTTKKVEYMYAAMDILVFPSLFEGLGIVAIEAQVNGLPVLCSEHVPPETCITDLAVRVPVELGAKAWSDAIKQYSGHKKLTQKQKDCCKQFDIELVSKQMQDILCM